MNGLVPTATRFPPSHLDVRDSERRQFSRCATVLQIAHITTATQDELCIVRDVSPGGMRAELYVGVDIAERVMVEFKNGLQLSGKVVWTNGDMVGIAFDARASIHAILTPGETPDGYRTRKPRVRAEGRARLRYDQYDIEVRLRDASQAGFKVEVDHYIEHGKECEVDTPGIGRLRGRVKWCQGGQAGIMLYQPMFYRDFANWRRARRTLLPA